MTDYAALVREARRCLDGGVVCHFDLIQRLADALEEANRALELEFGESGRCEPSGPIDLSKLAPKEPVPGTYAEILFDNGPPSWKGCKPLRCGGGKPSGQDCQLCSTEHCGPRIASRVEPKP